jgi:hypothetical protein
MNPSPFKDLNIIEAEIDEALYDVFLENIHTERFLDTTYTEDELLTTEENIISAINNAMAIYLEFIENEVYEQVLYRPKQDTIKIKIKGINPQIHQKFIKYIKKQYKGQNFQKHYNNELNLAIALYTLSIQIPTKLYIETIHNLYNVGDKELDTLLLMDQEEYIKQDFFKEEFHAVCQKHGLNPETEAQLYGCL